MLNMLQKITLLNQFRLRHEYMVHFLDAMGMILIIFLLICYKKVALGNHSAYNEKAFCYPTVGRVLNLIA